MDVGSLANGTTRRRFEVEGVDPVGNITDGVIVQFWRSSCTQIGSARAVTGSSTFVIQSGSKWMTVVGTHNRAIEWWLT